MKEHTLVRTRRLNGSKVVPAGLTVALALRSRRRLTQPARGRFIHGLPSLCLVFRCLSVIVFEFENSNTIIPMPYARIARTLIVALILLARGILHRARSPESEQTRRESDYLLTATDVMLIGFELMVIFLFIMYAQLTIGGVKEAVAVILPGGDLAVLFWVGVVLIGLLIPALIELYYVVPKLVYHRGYNAPRIVDIAVSGAVLLGGFLLRYVVLVAGQVTGPVGI